MYNSYTSISYKSAAADLHRNLKPLQRMALLSRGFRLYHLHIWNAYSKLDSSFRTAGYCRYFILCPLCNKRFQYDILNWKILVEPNKMEFLFTMRMKTLASGAALSGQSVYCQGERNAEQ